jgi:hypothetical protein
LCSPARPSATTQRLPAAKRALEKRREKEYDLESTARRPPSDLVAGTADRFDRNDTLIPGGSDSVLSRIANVTIRGTATGSTIANDFFGITAESIRKTKISGIAFGLSMNQDDLLLDPANGDFRLVEL